MTFHPTTKSTSKLFLLWMALLFPSAVFAAIGQEQAVVQHEVKSAELLEQLAFGLSERGAGEGLEVNFLGKQPDILVRAKNPITVEIADLEFDAKAQRWSAKVTFYDDKTPIDSKTLTGRYHSTVEIPVLTRRLFSDDIIEEEDIVWQKMSEYRLRKNTVTTAKDLIGKSPRRVISDGRPILSNEIENPIVVKKGEMVQVEFQTPFMLIRVLAEALEDGAQGQVVRMRNSTSKLVIQAVVTGSGMATIQQHAQVAQLEQKHLNY